MNFIFKVGDTVKIRSGCKQAIPSDLDQSFVIAKEFIVKGLGAGKLFRLRSESGRVLRVYSKDLLRLDRPEDLEAIKAKEERKALRKLKKDAKEAMVARRKEEFADMAKLKIPLTAEGLPDKRYKPRYTAATSPITIKASRRGGLI